MKMKNGSTTKTDSSRSEGKRLVAESIRLMGQKWDYCPRGKTMVRDSCLSINPEWYEDLQSLQRILIAIVFLLASPIVVGYFTILANHEFRWRGALKAVFREEPCVVKSLAPQWSEAVLSSKANCHSICQGLKQVPIVENITPEEFSAKYAYSGRPVILRGSMGDWKAFKTFGFSFFKRVFQPHAERFTELTASRMKDLPVEDAKSLEDCQFFPYATEFETLAEFFNISEARSRLESSEKSYYVGWNNCFREVVDELRDHYSRPEFLPADSESSRVDWIFMGGSTAVAGGGAPVHLDMVARPSWQAVVAGAKKWMLYAPPECESVCAHEIVADMKKGDVLAVDTNLWYHGTKAEQGVLTIAIGSEYD